MRGPSSLFLFFVLFLFFGLGSSSLPTLSLVHEKKVSELVGASGRYEASGYCFFCFLFLFCFVLFCFVFVFVFVFVLFCFVLFCFCFCLCLCFCFSFCFFGVFLSFFSFFFYFVFSFLFLLTFHSSFLGKELLGNNSSGQHLSLFFLFSLISSLFVLLMFVVWMRMLEISSGLDRRRKDQEGESVFFVLLILFFFFFFFSFLSFSTFLLFSSFPKPLSPLHQVVV